MNHLFLSLGLAFVMWLFIRLGLVLARRALRDHNCFSLSPEVLNFLTGILPLIAR